MSQIAFLAPHESLANLAKQTLHNTHPDIDIATGLLQAGVTAAKRLIDTGTEIIITRGGTALAIQQANLPITIVNLPLTGFDIIQALKTASKYGHKIGAVAFPTMLQEISSLSAVLNIDIHTYPLQRESAASELVNTAINDGMNAIIGGYITYEAATQIHFPCVLIESQVNSILQIAAEAKRIAHARNLEKAKTNLFQAVLNYAHEGILAINTNSIITFFNPVAETISNTTASNWIGKDIHQVWPELQLDNVMTSGKDNLGQILKINNVDVLCNKAAIIVNEHSVGAVVTFQAITQIQQLEAHVRHKIYTSGHIAKARFADIERTMAPLSPMYQIIEIAKQFALTSSNILLIGETGTGKELFAQSIHNYSLCAKGPFVAVNCAALPKQILESELFGYVSGAFTGASSKGKQGLFELAHDGTIFLDEIAEMDYSLQSKLLRVLQERQVMRLGSDKVIHVNARVIAATNKNLKDKVNDNTFRADLYYRLNVLQLKLPPLCKRQGDIPLLAQHFLTEPCSRIKAPLKLTPAAVKALTSYSWPGNIRELQNIMERAIAIHKHKLIDATDIKLLLNDDQSAIPSPDDILPDEYTAIKTALQQTNGKYEKAATLLGISRTTLWRKINKYRNQ